MTAKFFDLQSEFNCSVSHIDTMTVSNPNIVRRILMDGNDILDKIMSTHKCYTIHPSNLGVK